MVQSTNLFRLFLNDNACNSAATQWAGVFLPWRVFFNDLGISNLRVACSVRCVVLVDDFCVPLVLYTGLKHVTHQGERQVRTRRRMVNTPPTLGGHVF